MQMSWKWNKFFVKIFLLVQPTMKSKHFLTVARVVFWFKPRQGSRKAYHGPKALAGSAVRSHKVNFLFLVMCGSIFSELLDLRNQYSACNRSVYTTCTQWLHHPIYILVPRIYNIWSFFKWLVGPETGKQLCMASVLHISGIGLDVASSFVEVLRF